MKYRYKVNFTVRSISDQWVIGNRDQDGSLVFISNGKNGLNQDFYQSCKDQFTGKWTVSITNNMPFGGIFPNRGQIVKFRFKNESDALLCKLMLS